MKINSDILLMLFFIVFQFSCGRKAIDDTIFIPGINDRLTKEINPEIGLTNYNEIIIEGTVIVTNRRFYQNTIFSSCVVEINTIFKGSIDDRVIEIFVMGGTIGDTWVSLSHGQISLPPNNSTAIFRIKQLEKDNYRKELMALTPFKLYYGVGNVKTIFPNSSYGLDRINIEKEIYQKLESESGKERQHIFLPATNDQIAINYSTKNSLLLPNRKKGMVYKMTPVQESEKEDYIGFYIHMGSTNSVSYLQKGELIIEYNTTAFGDSIISRERLIYDIPRNYQIVGSSRHNAIPEHFEVTLEDIASDKIKVEWKNSRGVDSCLQLLPQEKGIYSATLYFLPVNDKEPINIKLIGVDSLNLQYDYEQKKIVPFEYTATDEVQYFQAKDLMPAIITDIFPSKIFQPLDTVQLRGKNFMRNPEVSIYAKGTNGHYRYRRIPKSHVLNKTDSLITIIIPNLALSESGSDLSEEWFPTSGKIKITKGYGQFKVMTWSKEKINITNTAHNKR